MVSLSNALSTLFQPFTTQAAQTVASLTGTLSPLVSRVSVLLSSRVAFPATLASLALATFALHESSCPHPHAHLIHRIQCFISSDTFFCHFTIPATIGSLSSIFYNTLTQKSTSLLLGSSAALPLSLVAFALGVGSGFHQNKCDTCNSPQANLIRRIQCFISSEACWTSVCSGVIISSVTNTVPWHTLAQSASLEQLGFMAPSLAKAEQVMLLATKTVSFFGPGATIAIALGTLLCLGAAFAYYTFLESQQQLAASQGQLATVQAQLATVQAQLITAENAVIATGHQLTRAQADLNLALNNTTAQEAYNTITRERQNAAAAIAEARQNAEGAKADATSRIRAAYKEHQLAIDGLQFQRNEIAGKLQTLEKQHLLVQKKLTLAEEQLAAAGLVDAHASNVASLRVLHEVNAKNQWMIEDLKRQNAVLREDRKGLQNVLAGNPYYDPEVPQGPGAGVPNNPLRFIASTFNSSSSSSFDSESVLSSSGHSRSSSSFDSSSNPE